MSFQHLCQFFARHLQLETILSPVPCFPDCRSCPSTSLSSSSSSSTPSSSQERIVSQESVALMSSKMGVPDKMFLMACSASTQQSAEGDLQALEVMQWMLPTTMLPHHSPSFSSFSSYSSLTMTPGSSSSTSVGLPYYVASFSPLALPADLFVYLLAFLSPADLWRLCQVSRAMHVEVTRFMSRGQKFEYGAVRILHQEHSHVVPELSPRTPTLYDQMTFGASTSRLRFLSTVKTPLGQVQSRSSYWSAQAQYLVATITEGTQYEPKTEVDASLFSDKEVVVRQTGMDSGLGFSSESGLGIAASVATSITAQSSEAAPSLLLTVSSSSSDTSQPEATAVTSTSTSSPTPASPSPTTSQTSSTTTANFTTERALTTASSSKNAAPQDPLPLDRFQSMIDLIFDPNIVQLNHRRAIINCARFVSSGIDHAFTNAVATHHPADTDFRDQFLKRYSVETGPYLTVLSPVQYDDDGLELSFREQALLERTRSNTVQPPRELRNYFQIMLWHRCMTDLITLYTRLQRRHVPAPAVASTPTSSPSLSQQCGSQGKAVCVQDDPSVLAARDAVAAFPFCCHAHSLIFTTQYPFTFQIVPRSIRHHLRHLSRKIQSVRGGSWAGAFRMQGDRVPSGRLIDYKGPQAPLEFCTGSARPPQLHPADQRQNWKRQHKRRVFLEESGMTEADAEKVLEEEEEKLATQRRYRVEEQILQDTLTKQKLLALCHMACGLFLVDNRAATTDAPPAIMALLRQGSPWSKGIWRDGEWRCGSMDTPKQPTVTETMDRSWKRKERSGMEQGPWQKLCMATIQFLAQEDLAWGGNHTNPELSRLRATRNPTAWIYHE